MIIDRNTQERSERYRGVSHVKPITAAKELVSTLDLARLLCGDTMSETGGKWQACCPLPDHDDKTPSFFVFGDGRWRCFGCSRGGDVVDLYMIVNGYEEHEAGLAAGLLLSEFGHQPPQRPKSWFAKRERQRRTRDAIDREKVEHIKMLVFRLIWVPWLQDLPPWTRDEAKLSAWESSRKIAELLYEQRRSA
jgi:CHC2 zinc finger